MFHENVELIPYKHIQENIEFLKEKLEEFKELEQVLVFFSENNSSDLNALLGNKIYISLVHFKLNKNKGAVSALNMYYLINPFFFHFTHRAVRADLPLFAVLLLQIHQNDGVFGATTGFI